MISKTQVYQTLDKYFGYTTFRDLQENIVFDVLNGKDVFTLMPTGSGKSLCYQLPALLLDGVAIVVSPLISLMKDQVDGLVQNGIEAAFLNSTLDQSEQREIENKLLDNKIKILYLAPEKLVQESFINFLKKIQISFFAIDESHCISQWGHDFRPEYRKLNFLKQEFPETAIIALTATATERVSKDIVEQLKLNNPKIYTASFDRKNLYYEIRPKQNAFDQLIKYLENHKNESGIIYCFSRKQVEQLSQALKQEGIKALPYHAGLESDTRRLNQEKFIKDDVNIIVATTAFGMGINKPDVRFVIHYDLPQSLEQYYQETGRAGRDGLPSECILFFSYGDKSKIEYFIFQKPDPAEQQVAKHQLKQILDFAETQVCRRHSLLKYFGETYSKEKCLNCDNCIKPKDTFDATEIAQKVLSCVFRLNERFGINYVAKILKGGRFKAAADLNHLKLSTYGILRDLKLVHISAYVRQIVQFGYLDVTKDQFPVVKLNEKSHEVLKGKLKVFLNKIETEEISSRRGGLRFSRSDANSDNLFEKLRILRKSLADEQNIPPYLVFSDATLRDMVEKKPKNDKEFTDVKGVGNQKLERYGKAFMNVIRDFANEHNTSTSGDFKYKKMKPEAGLSARISVGLFKKGLTLSQIAKERSFAERTIMQHLEQSYLEGEEINLRSLIDKTKFETIKQVFLEIGIQELNPIKEKLGDDFSYEEIRLVRAVLWKESL